MSTSGRPSRIYVHVGLQKTGTSHLQGVMVAHREELARQGLDLVPPTKREMFHVMLDVRDRYQPGRDPASVAGALAGFADQLASATGPRALFTQESLAAATPAQIARLLDACGDREVHVVVTVRDLARQLPSSWQQLLKAGGVAPYPRYLDRMRQMEQAGSGVHPWIHLDPPAVLARWAEVVPAERIHVITVPPNGSAPTLLLERFCRVLGVDAARLTAEQERSNLSLGRVQAEVLLRVNAEIPDELRRRWAYGDVGKRFFAAQVLGAQASRRIGVPTSLRTWCVDVADRQVAALAAAGYRVEGSLEELRCDDSAFSDDECPPAEVEVATAAVSALARILTIRIREGRHHRPGTAASGRGRGLGVGLLRKARNRLRR